MTYIPRSSLPLSGNTGAVPRTIRSRQTFRVFGFVGSIAITLSLILAAGSFFYRGYLEGELTKAMESLKGQSSADYENKILEVGLFNHKLDSAKVLLKNHLSPSLILKELEMFTKRTVQLSQFSYGYDPGYEVTLNMTGGTTELSSVSLQKETLRSNKIFSGLKVSEVSLSLAEKESLVEGEKEALPVGFTIQGFLEKDSIGYTGNGIAGIIQAFPEAGGSVFDEIAVDEDLSDDVEDN